MAWEGFRKALRDDAGGVGDVLGETKAVAPWIDPVELAWCIELESQWRPQATNPTSGATGLIQFMPATAAMLGTTTTALRRMSLKEQAPYVASYFARGVRPSPGKVYLAIFAPAYLMRSDSTVIFAPGSAGWRQNPGLRESPTGPITVASVKAKGQPPPGGLPGPAGQPPQTPPRKGPPGAPPGTPPKKGPPSTSEGGWILLALLAWYVSESALSSVLR